MKRALLVLAAAAALAGCAFERRHFAVRPGVNQALSVVSGDRIFFDMDENPSTGLTWDFTCDDPDVEVSIAHKPPKRGGVDGEPGSASVEIRVHRGYDGPSTIVFSLRRPGAGPVDRRFTITLFRKTGDAAFWR